MRSSMDCCWSDAPFQEDQRGGFEGAAGGGDAEFGALVRAGEAEADDGLVAVGEDVFDDNAEVGECV